MALTWLHVSDFHMRSGDAYAREVVLRAPVSSRGRATVFFDAPLWTLGDGSSHAAEAAAVSGCHIGIDGLRRVLDPAGTFERDPQRAPARGAARRDAAPPEATSA